MDGDIDRKEVEAIEPFFDRGYYLSQYPDVAAAGVDPIAHYLVYGWKEGRDPNADFSTSYYLKVNDDIRTGGINPFVHYCRYGRFEKREAAPYYRALAEKFHPLVSVIVPNYNHANFLPERVRSILAQTYQNIELIVLDDCSSDNSVDVIKSLIADISIPVRVHFNSVNSGNVFSQWQRGIDMAKGEFIWICESDDTCESDFLERIIPHFVDRSVMLAFGNIQFCNTDGNRMEGMDGFREESEPGIWGASVKRPAKQWFCGAFGINNVVANVGGCAFRKSALSRDIWDKAKSFKIAGDWYLYSRIIGGGQMVYEPAARTYFRQHARNTSASNFNKMYYYEELWRLLEHKIDVWGIPAPTRDKFLHNMKFQYHHHGMEKSVGPFEEHFDVPALMQRERQESHIVMAFLGFHSGGGEVFPISLANELTARGRTVSMLAYNMSEINEAMLNSLDPHIPIYHFGELQAQGRNSFLENIGASLIHSHVVHCDSVFFRNEQGASPVPYIVTLHGSYDSLKLEAFGLLFQILRGVTHWVYTADKNLEIFGDLAFDPAALSKVRNALPRDMTPFPKTRKELGIHPEAVVFTLVARGIPQKGWRASLAAFRRLQAERPDINAHLLLIGTGEKADQTLADVSEDERITYLGYQSEINGIYRMTDCAIVPTRFSGESFPLCVIQALQEATPVIATDIGEIRSMVTGNGLEAGILLQNKRNSKEFFADLFTAMVEMADPAKRRTWTANAQELGKRFDMPAMIEIYDDIYRRAEQRHRLLRDPASGQPPEERKSDEPRERPTLTDGFSELQGRNAA